MPGNEQRYLIGYCKNGRVELGWFFESISRARAWARRFCRDFDAIVIYEADGSVLETIRS